MTDNSIGRSSPLDTIMIVATPENVAFDFRIAGPFPRFIALMIDLILLVTIAIGLLILLGLLGLLGGSGMGLLLFAGFVGWWGYGGLLEAFWNGQTLGKKCLGIRVVSDSGLAINAGQAFLRNILRSADLIPPFFPGIFSMLLGSRFQRLGDLAAETVVVIDGGGFAPRPPRTERRADEIRDLIPAKFRADNALIEALAGYVGRRGDLSPARQRELASTLARYFRRVWNLPPKTDPDLILCAIYDRATRDNIDRQPMVRSNPK